LLTKVQTKRTIDTPTANSKETEAPKQSGFDDFDEAFSAKLNVAQTVSPSATKDFDNTFNSAYVEFDGSFDKPHDADKSAGKSQFATFDFSDFESQLGATSATTSGNVHDDLDSIFGTATTVTGQNNVQPSTQSFSFDDAFGSFDAPAAPSVNNAQTTPNASSSKPAAAGSNDDDKLRADDKLEIQQLVGMGFSRSQAVDALRRYDNNLEKATNFLLDN
jgi:epidermal growth factor receptor substrate 15